MLLTFFCPSPAAQAMEEMERVKSQSLNADVKREYEIYDK